MDRKQLDRELNAIFVDARDLRDEAEVVMNSIADLRARLAEEQREEAQ